MRNLSGHEEELEIVDVDGQDDLVEHMKTKRHFLFRRNQLGDGDELLGLVGILAKERVEHVMEQFLLEEEVERNLMINVFGRGANMHQIMDNGDNGDILSCSSLFVDIPGTITRAENVFPAGKDEDGKPMVMVHFDVSKEALRIASEFEKHVLDSLALSDEKNMERVMTIEAMVVQTDESMEEFFSDLRLPAFNVMRI